MRNNGLRFWSILALLLGLPAAVPAQTFVPPPTLTSSVPDTPASSVLTQEPTLDWLRNGVPVLRGLSFYGELLLVMPQRDGLQNAVVTHSANGMTSSTAESLSWSTTPALRIGGAYQLPGTGIELAATFTYLHAKDQQTVLAGPGDSLFGTYSNNPNARTAGSSDGDAGLSYGVVDLDVGKSIHVDDAFSFKVFGGVRMAVIDQTLKSIYSGGSLGSSPDYVDIPINFRGAGLSAGGEANWNVFRGWGLYGRGRVALLSGEFTTDRNEYVGGASYSSSSVQYGTIIPVVELGGGLNYRGERLLFSAGYELIDWINMVSGVSNSSSPGQGLTPKKGDLTLEAVTFRLGYRF
ncbi:Lpg1974 family pore-forming outer membrane protein [Fimbriiglobus ruber]|uniref:Major outer membrane protein n=1 Tax=Fimbriiglobus ruber TaxID=1908690 RepID=A0A225E121_9BACT|nr:Lpg1974 family pore-forming outer membrane protein [Fimbriiglobus ruber]OWK43716.1 Major outer membrane protein [Fimbriiglobus ruber]